MKRKLSRRWTAAAELSGRQWAYDALVAVKTGRLPCGFRLEGTGRLRGIVLDGEWIPIADAAACEALNKYVALGTVSAHPYMQSELEPAERERLVNKIHLLAAGVGKLLRNQGVEPSNLNPFHAWWDFVGSKVCMAARMAEARTYEKYRKLAAGIPGR